jgi:hypothetical protein
MLGFLYGAFFWQIFADSIHARVARMKAAKFFSQIFADFRGFNSCPRCPHVILHKVHRDQEH